MPTVVASGKSHATDVQKTPVEVAEAKVKPPKPPRASRRESQDAILARIIAGISVPGSELDAPAETPATRKSSTDKPVELASAQTGTRRHAGASRSTDETVADDVDTPKDKSNRRKSSADADSSAGSSKADRARHRKIDADDDGNTGSSKADRTGRKNADADDTTSKSSRKSTGRKGGKSSDEKTSRDKDDDSRSSDKSTRSRIFVQVAGGAHDDDLGKAWDATRKKAPDLFRGKQGYTTPLRATNRVLAGPFKDEDEAQAFINKLAGKGMSGFLFTSTKGQKVDKLPAKSGKSSK